MTPRATFSSSHIITMLPSSPQVKSVYSESIIPTLRKLHMDSSEHTFCIDSTTLDVDIAREVASGVKNAGARMIDAPVSGGASYTIQSQPAIVPITCMQA